MSSCYACGEDLNSIERSAKPIQLVACSRCLNVSQIKWENNEPVVEPVPGFASLGTLAPRESVMAGILAVVPKSIETLPVLAEIPQRVVATIHDPISSVHDVVAIIEEDAVLSTKILSLANSAYFSTVSEINDLTTACSRLGLRQLANIATTMSSVNQYKSVNPDARKFMRDLWQHAVATAHCAEALAMKFKLNTEVTFIAGLLHDIGKVALVDTITTKYTGNVGRLNQESAILAKAIGPLSPIVGLRVVQHWKLSDELAFSTLYSQHPDAMEDESSKALAHCVGLASDIAEVKGYGLASIDSTVFDEHPSLKFFNISREEFDTMSEQFDEMIDSVMAVFGGIG